MFGSIAELMPIAQALPENLPIYGVEAKGLNGDEPPYDRVEAMADFYADAIMRLQPEGPYSVVGNCFGGLVAIEIARCLLARGQDIGLLACLDTFPHPRFWPLRLRIAYFGRRFAQNSIASLSVRGFRDKGDTAFTTPPQTLPLAAKAVFQAAAVAQAEYRPCCYPGKVNFLMCGYDGSMPNAHSSVWKGWLGGMEEQFLPKDCIQTDARRDEYVASWIFDRLPRRPA